MSNDDICKAVQNQKVFISLKAFETLVSEYRRVSEALVISRKEGNMTSLSGLVIRKQTLEFVFNTTHLPVNI